MFLDLDGTLIDIAETPQAVVVPTELPALLARLGAALSGAVAIVSGRAVTDIDALLPTLRLAAAGQHGAEMRLPGQAVVPSGGGSNRLSGLLPRIEAFAAARPGLLVENKGLTVAVHYRLAPRHRDALGQFVSALADELGDEFETIAGHCVFEIRPHGLNKGGAVRRFLEAAPFAGRVPVFVGDDRTDEDGFAAAIERGGMAIRVGPPAPTRATFFLADPAATRAWLAEVADRLAALRG